MELGEGHYSPERNGSDTPTNRVFWPVWLYLRCILSAIHPLYLRHSDVLYRCVFSRYVVRYRSGIGLHAWCLHVLSIQYMRMYRCFSILNDTHRYMTSLSPLPRGCCACVSIQEAPSCILTYLCLTNECIFLCPRPWNVTSEIPYASCVKYIQIHMIDTFKYICWMRWVDTQLKVGWDQRDCVSSIRIQCGINVFLFLRK